MDKLRLLFGVFIAAFLIGFIIKEPIYIGGVHKQIGVDYKPVKYIADNGSVKYCEPRLTKHSYGPGGEILRSHCLSLKELKLKRCSMDAQCSPIEACIDGFCTVVAEEANQSAKSEMGSEKLKYRLTS